MAKKKDSTTRATSRGSATVTKKKVPQKQCKTSAPMQKYTKREDKVGEIWRGETKYIDPEPKKQRNYVVVVDNGKRQSVSKLKSIKIFDADGKNADKALIEINATRYGLEKRTGVDREVFTNNRMSGKPLKVSDKKAFPEDKPRAKLGSHDKSRVKRHVGKKNKR